MAFASQVQKEEIRSRVALEDLLRDYNVALTPSGKRLKGLCPFHNEKTPSFSVDPERQFFYCFGCQEKGDVFDFVQKIDHVDFATSLETLARRAGVELTEGHRPGAGNSTRRTYDALTRASEFYHQTLVRDASAQAARDYLERRGVERSMWETFRLGFAPAQGNLLVQRARTEGVAPEVLERGGLARERDSGGYYDLFRGRLMFPIQDERGRVAGFGARTLGDDVPKYINTPKTAVFDKSQMLYGLSQARRGIQREGRIAVVEGYTDVIAAHQAGLDFFVASLGTAFTEENAKRLGRLAPRVLLVFDGDAAGQKASERSLDLLVGENLDVRIYTLPEGKDPADCITATGGEAFHREALDQSVGIFEFKWKRTVGAVDGGDAPGAGRGSASVRARALDEFLALLAKVPNVVARKLYLREFAERLGVDEADIQERMKLVRPSPRSFLAPRSFSADNEGAESFPVGAAAGGGDAFGDGQVVDGQVVDGQVVDGQVVDGQLADGSAGKVVTELEDLILECLVALPHQAGDLLAQVPTDFIRNPARRALVRSIELQLEDGTLATNRLLNETEEPQARDWLLGVLGRVENDDGSPTRDYKEVWRLALRDVERQWTLRRVDELKRAITAARKNGDQSKLPEYQREYFETIRRLKRSKPAS